MEAFNDYGKYYDLLYQEKEYELEAGQVHKLIQKYSVNRVKSIIDIGCGTGRHDYTLSKYGYKLMGIDMSETMVEIAKKRGGGRYVVADARTFRVDNSFDAAISLFHVISYINNNQDLLKAFQSIREAVCYDSIFVFSAWYGFGVLTDLPETRYKEVEDDNIRIMRIAEPVLHNDQNVVDVNYTIQIVDKNTAKTNRIKEKHCMRYFFKPEIELMLDISGFRLIDVLDEKTLGKLDCSSWTCYFVARAI